MAIENVMMKPIGQREVHDEYRIRQMKYWEQYRESHGWWYKKWSLLKKINPRKIQLSRAFLFYWWSCSSIKKNPHKTFNELYSDPKTSFDTFQKLDENSLVDHRINGKPVMSYSNSAIRRTSIFENGFVDHRIDGKPITSHSNFYWKKKFSGHIHNPSLSMITIIPLIIKVSIIILRSPLSSWRGIVIDEVKYRSLF